MKIIITGFSGFVSKFFVEYLETEKIDTEVLGIDIVAPDYAYDSFDYVSVNFNLLNLLDPEKTGQLVKAFKPDFILHLASYSSVGFSWKNPELCFRNNMNIFLNLIENVREFAPLCRILSVGSSEQYGVVDRSLLPLLETYPLNPGSPYAVARVSQEQLSKVYCEGFGLDILMTRSFNHIGAGQKDVFVIASFARQLVEIKKGIRQDNKLITGDITVVRDFLDVRDVVEAYYRLFISGVKGEVYNVCSGIGTSLRDVIDIMCSILNVEISIETNPDLLRPNDNKTVIGSNEKLIEAAGWCQKISLRESLESIIHYWDKRSIN